MARAYRIVVRGRVQGVGFRRMVWSLARRRGLAGYVRNLSDGSVEIVVAAERGELDWFLSRLRSLRVVEVEDISVEEAGEVELPSEFEIR